MALQPMASQPMGASDSQRCQQTCCLRTVAPTDRPRSKDNVRLVWPIAQSFSQCRVITVTICSLAQLDPR